MTDDLKEGHFYKGKDGNYYAIMNGEPYRWIDTYEELIEAHSRSGGIEFDKEKKEVKLLRQ